MVEPKIFWSLIFSTILLMSGIAGSIQPVFASEGYFEDDYRRELYSEPTVCIFQPNDARVDKQKWAIWVSDMKPALETWRSILSSSSYGGNWGITLVDIPLDKQDRVNYSACDIKVHFTPKSYPEHPEWLGWYTYGTGEIKLVYTKSEICKTVINSKYHIYEYGYCQTELLERSKRMASVLQHEFGHALGLSHYVSDNSALIQQWYDNEGIGAPSIMTFQPPNEELKKITNLDVELVHKIYSTNGFGKKSNTQSVFLEPVVEPKYEPEVSGIQNIQVKPYQTTSAKITGHIPEELYSRGTPVEFEVTKPNGSKESFATMVSRHQYFEYPMVFDSNSISGTYQILVIYKGEFVQKTTVNVSKSSITTNPQNSKIEQKTPTQTSILKPSLYAIDENGKKSKTITVKPDQKFSVEGYIYKNNIPQKYTAYKIQDNIGNVRDGTTNSNGFFKNIFTAKHSNYQTFGQVGGKDSTMIIKACVSSNCEDVTIYIRENDHTISTTEVDKTESKKQSIISENELDLLLSKRNDIEKRISDIEYKFKQSFESLKQSEKDFIGEIPKKHIDNGWDIRLKLLKEFPDLYALGREIIQNIDTLEYEQKNGNIHSVYVLYIKRDIGFFESRADKMSSDMKYISQEIEFAKKAFEKLHPKTCFLFWC